MAFNKNKWEKKYADALASVRKTEEASSYSTSGKGTAAKSESSFNKENWERKYADSLAAIRGTKTSSSTANAGVNGALPNNVLASNNPAYLYAKTYGNGKTGAAANKPVKGTATPRSRFEPADTERPRGRASAQRAFTSTPTGNFKGEAVVKSALSSSAAAYKKLVADAISSSGNLSMGESARTAIDEVKTAKKEGRQAKLGQAQRKAEQKKAESFNDGWMGDFKQKLLAGAEESSERAYEYEQEAKEGLGKFGQGVVDFGIAGAQFAGDALLNAVAPGSGLAAMAGRAYGSASLEAQQRGLSEGEQQISGIKSAAIEMLTEKLFGSVSKVAYGKGIIKNENLVNNLVNRLAKTDKGRTALKVLVGANEEGMEEVLSDILNPVADRILKLDDGKGDWSDLTDDFNTQQMLEDYIIGGALGLVGAGTNVVSGQYRAENAQQRAYEEYQRQLVNAGLATEQGSDAQLTAEKYKNILDQSTQRGKRNLSDKETENLESLIRGTYAQEDASDVSSRLAQLGTDADEQTVNAIVKAVNGETLNRAEQKAFDANPYSQRVVNEMLDTEGVTSNEWYADRASAQSFTPESSNGISVERAQNVLNTSTTSNPVFVNSMARQYDVAPEVVERTYNLNPTAPQAFETAFNAVYQMGQQGTDKAALSKVPVLNTAQANIAYQMGADSVNTASVSTDTAAPTQTAAPVDINNTQEVNENGVRIHNVAERIDGQNTEGQIRGVEAVAGENVGGRSQQEQGGTGEIQIKAGEKVSYKGKQQKGVYYAAEDTEDMKKGRELAESYGYKVRYFIGGDIRYAGGEFRGVVDTANKTVMVRADHPDYTAEQIMRHEMGHAAFENGDLSIDEAREMLLDDFTADELNELIEIYSNAYGGILSAEEAFEEICCDALGRMNVFEGTDLNSESYGKAQDTVRKYAAERTGSKGRAPPKNGGVKYSKEASGSIKQQLRKSENELNKMEPVAIVNTPDLSKMNIKQQRQWAESFLKNTGYAVSRKDFGKIEFTPRHINEGLNYIKSPSEISAFAALPRVLKRGIEIDAHEQHKGRKRDSITIAAPIVVNGTRGNMAVVVTITAKNHYHAHRVLLPNGGEFVFGIEKADSKPAEAAPNAESSPIESTSENSIRSSSENVNEKFSREVKSAEEDKVNSAMTMDEAKRMLESAFRIFKVNQFSEYRNADEWLRDVGSEDVELNIESEYSLYQKYIGSNEDILNEEYSLSDVLDAYLEGTLIGKENPKAKRMDTSKNYGLRDDRFYAPQKIENAKEFLTLANQKLTAANRNTVNNARAKVLLFAHNKGAAELLGMSQAELNKKLRSWSAYSAQAKRISEAANRGVAEENRWTGIENCAYISKTVVADGEIERLVGEIKGKPNGYEKRYIARVMLAADTHISYKGLKFVFESKRDVNARLGNPNGRTNGFYSPGNAEVPDMIVCSYDKPETVAHEMGHYIDTRWGRDLVGADRGSLFLTQGVNKDMIRARHGEDGIQFENNFNIFMNSLTDVNTAVSSYTNDRAEVFARFFAKFVEWTDNIATGSKTYSYESNMYGDKFTQSQYVEFIKLLQEKAMLDAKYEASQGKEKFSREPERLNELRRQNEELKQRVEYWKNQTRPTTTKTVRKSDVQKLAREVIDMSDTDLKPGDITESLNKLGEYILNEPELRYTDVAEMANSIASEVIENATAIVNEDDVEIHNDLKDYLKRVKFRDDGSTEFASVRRNYKRRIMFDKNGLGVNMAYAELHNMFGGGYFPEDIINPGDMLKRIAEVLDGTAPKYGNPNSYYRKEATEFLRNYIIDSMLGDQVRQTAPTYADKANAKLAETKADYNQRLRKQREEFNAKTTSIKEQNKQHVKEAISKERQRGERRLQKFHDSVKERDTKRKEIAEKSRYKKQIEKNVKTLSDWLLKPDHKNALKHIPGELQSTVRDFIASINFTSARQLGGGAATQKDMKYLSNLERLHRYITDGNVGEDRYSGYLDLPPNFDVELGNFIHEVNALARKNSGYTINDMTVEQLKELSNIVKTMKKTITDMNRMYQNKTFQHAYDAGVADVDNLKLIAKTKPFLARNITSTIDNFVMWQQARPVHAFSRFGEGGKSICRELMDGQSTMAFLTKEIIDFAENTYTTEEVKTWAKETHTFELENDKVTLTTAQLMGLYELNKRPQAKQHLDAGGFKAANFKSGKTKIQRDTVHRFSDAELNEMFSKLTDRQKEVADKLQRFMVEKGGTWGNYVSVKRFDVEMFKDDNYYPIKVSGTEVDSKEVDSVDNASLYKLLNMGFAKEVSPKANQALIVYDIFDVFSNHMAEMAQYRSFALPVLDAMKWFNYKERNESGVVTASLREEMSRVFGTDEKGRSYAESFIKNILKAYNGTEAQGSTFDTLGLKALSFYNRQAVAYNLRVVAQQPTAITRAAIVLNEKDLASSFASMAKNFKATAEEMEVYSGIAVWKSLGFYDVNVSRGVQELIKHDENWLERFNEIGMKGAEFADRYTWAAMWDACKKNVKRKGIVETDANFFDEVSSLFDEVIYKTQVVDSVLTKNEWARSKSFFARSMGAFMSEPATTASMVTDTIFNIQLDRARGMSWDEVKVKHTAKVGKVLEVYILQAICTSLAAALIDAGRDDDDYETLTEKLWNRFKDNLGDNLNPLNWYIFASDLVDFGKQMLNQLGFDTYGYGQNTVWLQGAEQLLKALKITRDLLSGEKTNYTAYGAAMKWIQAGSQFAGLPAYNIAREAFSMWNTIIGDFLGYKELKVKSYDPGAKNSVKYAFMDGYLTEQEAMDILQNEDTMGEDVLDENEAYFEVEKWKNDTNSNYTKLYNAIDNNGDIRGAVDELTEHGVEEKNIKSAITRTYKDAYINGSSAEREKIRRAMYATGLYDSVNDVIEKCNDWLKKTK